MSSALDDARHANRAEATRDITLEAVSVQLGERTVLREVSLHLSERRIAVIGANGSGKSTFARLLNGLLAPTTGTVRVHGVEAGGRHAKRLRAQAGFVFSNPDAQILMPTVAEDVRLSLRGSGLSKAEISARADAALASSGLDGHADAPAYSLSGGQKQMLALTAVLIREPSLVIADEPTTLLDLTNARRIGDLLIDDLDAQTVVVTHDLDLAARCDVAVRFRDGRVDAVGEPAAVIRAYRADPR